MSRSDSSVCFVIFSVALKSSTKMEARAESDNTTRPPYLLSVLSSTFLYPISAHLLIPQQFYFQHNIYFGTIVEIVVHVSSFSGIDHSRFV